MAEGKESEGGEALMARVIEHCSSAEWQGLFEDFARRQTELFADAAESKSGDVEHKLEYQDAYQEYLQLFEGHLSGLLGELGFSMTQFYDECRDAVEGNFTALFEEHHNKWFVDQLLGAMDYQHFFNLVVKAIRRTAGTAGGASAADDAADAKGGASDDDDDVKGGSAKGGGAKGAAKK